MIWQLLLSPLFPERSKWSPKCPKCGDEMTSDDMERINKMRRSIYVSNGRSGSSGDGRADT